MSSTTLNKDDLATQKMIAMLEGMEAETADSLQETGETTEIMTDTTLDSDIPLSNSSEENAVESLDELLEIEDISNETTLETEPESIDLEEILDEPENTAEVTETVEPSENTLNMEMVNKTKKGSTDEAPIEAQEGATIGETAETIHPHSAITELESALALQKETKLLAEKVKASSQRTTNLALEAAHIAQERTRRLQEEINATYQAAERARLLLEESDIEVDKIPNYSEAELPSILQEIHAKNETLKEQNEAIKALLN